MAMNPAQILFIEDDDIAVLAGTAVLKEIDCVFDIAKTGREALDYLNKVHYDLVLCDLGLPDIPGFQIARLTRKNEGLNQLTPMFALTAHKDELHEKRSINSGMTGFLAKPLRKETCLAVLRDIQDKQE
ncbi:MAG: response regulator [Gammaproteobacteria bacterium]|nr:response regulator [Gammaproteobacteria bacterium]